MGGHCYVLFFAFRVREPKIDKLGLTVFEQTENILGLHGSFLQCLKSIKNARNIRVRLLLQMQKACQNGAARNLLISLVPAQNHTGIMHQNCANRYLDAPK